MTSRCLCEKNFLDPRKVLPVEISARKNSYTLVRVTGVHPTSIFEVGEVGTTSITFLENINTHTLGNTENSKNCAKSHFYLPISQNTSGRFARKIPFLATYFAKDFRLRRAKIPFLPTYLFSKN